MSAGPEPWRAFWPDPGLTPTLGAASPSSSVRSHLKACAGAAGGQHDPHRAIPSLDLGGGADWRRASAIAGSRPAIRPPPRGVAWDLASSSSSPRLRPSLLDRASGLADASSGLADGTSGLADGAARLADGAPPLDDAASLASRSESSAPAVPVRRLYLMAPAHQSLLHI
jgi:X-X-X-Leu-X-X-Gly heptad repeat protein